jgi:hypothetical protein
MKLIKYLALAFSMAILSCLVPLSCFAQYPGLPDSMIIDTAFVPYNPGNYSTCYLPVYFVTDDSVCFISLNLKIESDDSMACFGRTIWHLPFTQWDDIYDTLINVFTIRTYLFCDLGGEPNPPLFTNYERLLGCDLRILIFPLAQPQVIWIDSTIGISFPGHFKRGYVRYGIPYSVDNELYKPDNYLLSQNYPNPFNSQTVISFELKEPAQTNVEIFDITGAKIATVVHANLSPGKHSVIWDASNYSSGVYFYRLNAGDYSRTEKMLLVK